MGKKQKQKFRQQSGKYHDHGTAIRQERGELVVENNIARVKKKQPLDDYFEKGLINGQQFVAGYQLQVDHAVAFGNRSILGTISELRSRGLNVPEDKMSAIDRYNRVSRQLSRESYQVAYQVLIECKSLAEIRGIMRWSSTNSGMDRLRETLDDIDEYYFELRRRQRQIEERKQEEGV